MSEVPSRAPDETKTPDKDLSQLFHDRARSASEEFHGRLVSFAAAALATYFLSLTSKDRASLSVFQTYVCLTGVVAMGMAVVVGLFSLYADTKRNYYKASEMQETVAAKKALLARTYDRWIAIQRRCRPLLILCFAAGIVASVVYLVTWIESPVAK